MILNGSYKYKKALIIDEKRLKEINELLLVFCSRIEIYATTIKDTQYQFENIDEMISVDNYGERRIKKIELIGYNDYHRDITINIFSSEGIVLHYNNSVECYYTFHDESGEILFTNKLNDILKKSTASYWLFNKVSIYGITLSINFILSLIGIMHNQKPHMEHTIIYYIIVLIISCLLYYFIYLIDRKIYYRFFPAVAFLWGEEKEKNKKLSTLKANIFWCIIVAVIVSIISAWLYSNVFGGINNG